MLLPAAARMDAFHSSSQPQYTGQPNTPDHLAPSGMPSLGQGPQSATNSNQKSTMQNAMQGTGDVKPRLTKEQHDILEAHFQQQHKPSTSTKKGFAETLGVPLDKINNWFQNRRAKVKQDLKKQMSAYNMQMYHATSLPIHTHPPFQPPTISRPPPQEYYSVNADMSPTQLPARPSDTRPPIDIVGDAIQPSQDYNNHVLHTISESTRPNAYDEMLSSSMAGYKINHVTSQEQFSGFQISDLPQSYSNDAQVPLTTSLLDGLSTESGTFPNAFTGYDDLGFDFTTFSSAASTTMPAVESHGSISSEQSAFSANQSTMTSQSSNSLHPASSVTSVYSGWTDEQVSSSDITPANQQDDPFENPLYGFQQEAIGSSAPQMLSPWSSAPQSTVYQSNSSSQTLLSSPPDVKEAPQLNGDQPDLEPPGPLSDDSYSRRSSSTTALVENMSAIGIQSRQPSVDGFKQPGQPSSTSSIAARRQRRPAALGPAALRSASYTNGMPASPNANQNLNPEQTLRRIRSSGVQNGRVQKVNPGSAQRSPLGFTFADAAASPKFARQASGFPAGSLAPPTPLTPNEMGRFPPWQNGPSNKSQTSMVETSSPESLPISWSIPSTAGFHSNAASPPTSPLDAAQVNAARFNNLALYRDTPPQSAPATQLCFSRAALMTPLQQLSEHQPTEERTAVLPRASHFRRPSLPDAGNAFANDPHIQWAVPVVNSAGDLQLVCAPQYKDMAIASYPYPQFKTVSLDSMPLMASMSAQPPENIPDLFVHEYSPPQGMGLASSPPRMQEYQPKNYIFANQGPGDFRNS